MKLMIALLQEKEKEEEESLWREIWMGGAKALKKNTGSQSTYKTKRPRTTSKDPKVEIAGPQNASSKQKQKWERVDVSSLPEVRMEKEEEKQLWKCRIPTSQIKSQEKGPEKQYLKRSFRSTQRK